MEPQGPKLAEGRDSVIYEHGSGRVLRLARESRSLVGEAEVMSYARARGFPVPEVFDAGDGYLVMARVDGVTMLEAAAPFGIRRYARLLAELHRRLHELPAPSSVRRLAEAPGERLLHGDFHPLNVLITDDGPVVIDWANAMAGDPAFDVADAWVVLACAEPPPNPVQRLATAFGRKLFLRWFLEGVDADAARAALRVAVARRLDDPNMSEGERARMERLVGSR